MNETQTSNPDRRRFVKMMSVGSLFCLGCSSLYAGAGAARQIKTSPANKDKFQDDSKMSMQRVFDFTYNEIILKVKLLQELLAGDIGNEKFIEYLKTAGERSGEIDAKKYAKSLGKNDLTSFVSELREPDYTVNHILTYDILKDAPKMFEVRIKECLWANTFRKNNAQDLGFAMFCNRDFRTASAFNPKIRLIRDKTIMQGHGYCNHRWVYEG